MRGYIEHYLRILWQEFGSMAARAGEFISSVQGAWFGSTDNEKFFSEAQIAAFCSV